MTDTVWDAEVIILLRKSKTRQMVLEYLVSIHPEKSYPLEIARKINLRSTDVCGALNGVSHRFKKENGLVNLNLVEKIEEKGVFLYGATKLGCKIWKLMNE